MGVVFSYTPLYYLASHVTYERLALEIDRHFHSKRVSLKVLGLGDGAQQLFNLTLVSSGFIAYRRHLDTNKNRAFCSIGSAMLR